MRMIRKALIALSLAAVAILAYGQNLTLLAQTALYSTTLSAALSAPTQGNNQTVITLTSGTNVAVGQGIVVDNEYLTVQSSTPQSTRWNVVRGQGGTVAAAHASGAPVFFGAPNLFQFTSNEPAGPCVSTATAASPFIVISPGVSIFQCPAVSTLTGSTAATWAQITSNGLPAANPTRYTGWTYTTAGALRIQPGVQFIGSGGALAMTLAAPDKYMDGMVMVLQASTAQAHTVTYTAGFYGNTTSSDVATFGGAIGDNFVIYASNGAWRVQSLKSVTLG